MAAATSQLFFAVFLFCGACLVPCQADHSDHHSDGNCTLAKVRNCTKTLELTRLKPITKCPQTELTCLEDLESCTAIDKIISVFQYLCNNQTGGPDSLAVNLCFGASLETKGAMYTQLLANCTGTSEWTDTLTGQDRCSAAKTYATCLKTGAESLCSGTKEVTYYGKMEDLFKSYGCFQGESGFSDNDADFSECAADHKTLLHVEEAEEAEGAGTIMMPHPGMMVMTLVLCLVTRLFK